jgi:hypothetical protein
VLTPVVVTVGVRESGRKASLATVRYRRIQGTRAEKLQALDDDAVLADVAHRLAHGEPDDADV